MEKTQVNEYMRITETKKENYELIQAYTYI